MCAVQRMTGIRVVVERDVCEAFRQVAGIATPSHKAVVVVVFAVAGKIVGFHFIAERIVAVAVAADEQGVLAGQFESRIARVIEGSVLPLGRLVTVAALLATAAVMGVVLGMARIAGARCVDKRMLGMAIEAAGGFMATDQCEARCRVIESHVRPAAW